MEKLTKRQYYAMFGIVYADGKITDPDGRAINELLKEGNSKTGKHVLTWSLPAGSAGTCICDCPGCYAKTGFYKASSVKECLARNLYYVNKYPLFVKHAIIAQVLASGAKEVRIHASGDFNTANPRAYATMWKEIASACPDASFWTYTKMEELENMFDGMDNANIVKSIIPGRGVNYGHCDYVIRLYEILTAAGENVFICRCGIDKNQHCENCGHCATSKYVLFLEHSTDYKAEKDPLYPVLCDIVNAQAM